MCVSEQMPTICRSNGATRGRAGPSSSSMPRGTTRSITFDVSDILNYDALSTFSAAESAAYLEQLIPDKGRREDILWYHRRTKSLAKRYAQFDEAAIGRLIGKYWKALDAMEDLTAYLDSIKKRREIRPSSSVSTRIHLRSPHLIRSRVLRSSCSWWMRLKGEGFR